jgi:hypothetical protein
MVQCPGNDIGLRQISLDIRSDGLSGCDFHVDADVLQLVVDDAAEDAREHQRVVDLVRVVAAPCGDDGHARLMGLLWVDLGVGVRQSEHDRLGGHQLDPFGLESSAN